MYEEVVRFLFGTAAAVLIPTVIPLFFRWLGRSNQKELEKNFGKEHVTLRLPWPFFWVGVLSTIVSSIIVIGIVKTTEKTKLLILILIVIMALLAAMGVFMVSSYFTWKICQNSSESMKMCQ